MSKRGFPRKIIYVLLAAVFLLTAMNETFAYAETITVRVGRVIGSVHVREEASNVSKDLGVLSGISVYVLGEEEGPSSYENKTWYKVCYLKDGETKYGYMHSKFVEITGTAEIDPEAGLPSGDDNTGSGDTGNTEPGGTGTGTDDPGQTTEPTQPSSEPEPNKSFEEELAAFPEDYQALIVAVHEAYPSWHFIAVNTGLDWNDVVAAESAVGHCLISGTSNPAYINLEDVDKNGKQIVRDGTNWVSASRYAVEYYLDPRNFLNTSNIFMFESLSYEDNNTYDINVVNSILKKTFMHGDYTCTDTGETKNFEETFMEAGQQFDVNPYYLASRAKSEQGNKGNQCGTGTVSGYEGYYNIFNVGAYVHDGRTANTNGAIYASREGTYGRPWTSYYKAIMGGAEIIGSNYISVGQDTCYYQKFNVIYKARLYSHEYATSVSNARNQATNLKNAYTTEVLESSLVFKIPFYKNMPAEPIPLPENRNPEDDSQPAVTPGTTDTPQAPVEINLTSKKYSVSGKMISGIAEHTTVATFRKNVTISAGEMKVYDTSNKEIKDGEVTTGSVIKLIRDDGTVDKSFTLVLLGDINADGKISIVDLILVRKQLLGMSSTKNEYFQASDVNQDGKVSIVDLIFIRKHLLGLSSIS